jgi:TonB family protein
MTGFLDRETLFKRALVVSLALHGILFIMIVLSPSLPKPGPKGMIHYVSFNPNPGGGGPGGGGGGVKPAAAPPPAKKELLRDLAVASKVKPEAKPSMTYPVAKAKRDPKAKAEKKTAISKPQPALAAGVPVQGTAAGAGVVGGSGAGGTGGSGLRIGLGEGPGGGGSGFGDQVGLSNFPFQYYLQIITDRVSSSWFTSLVDPGVSGTYTTTVYFKIMRNGRVADLEVKESSGIESLDMSAQRAIQGSAPFPPLPADYEGDYLGIHLIFEHAK